MYFVELVPRLADTVVEGVASLLTITHEFCEQLGTRLASSWVAPRRRRMPVNSVNTGVKLEVLDEVFTGTSVG